MCVFLPRQKGVILVKNVDYYPVNKKQGDIGEYFFRSWLSGCKWNLHPYNKKDDIEHWVDITGEFKSKTVNFDVKWDTKIHSTDNIAFETYSNKPNGEYGWGLSEDSWVDFVVVFVAEAPVCNRQFWIFDKRHLCEYYNRHENELRHELIGEAKTTEVALIPLIDIILDYGCWFVSEKYGCKFCGLDDMKWKLVV